MPFRLDPSRPLHLDHGYCSTVHAAQGQTAERVLFEAETQSAMANESLYYVAISRARSEGRAADAAAGALRDVQVGSH